MKNLARGGAVLVLTSLFVVFIYSQTRTTTQLAIANDSQKKIEKNISSDHLDKSFTNTKESEKVDTGLALSSSDESFTGNGDDEKGKLVKKTASVKAVNAAGMSRGAFSATAYCFSGKTAMGHSVRRGLIAADPRVLPLGSRVVITAGQWSGTYLVSDTGGAIKGKRIDIWVPNCGEARRFGRRTVTISMAQ